MLHLQQQSVTQLLFLMLAIRTVRNEAVHKIPRTTEA
jgi:hypothetical protein